MPISPMLDQIHEIAHSSCLPLRHADREPGKGLLRAARSRTLSPCSLSRHSHRAGGSGVERLTTPLLQPGMRKQGDAW